MVRLRVRDETTAGDRPEAMRDYWSSYAFGELSATDGSSDRRGSGWFLPFEDSMLSMILSKALLLADDRRIEDPAIVSQIRG